MLLPGRGECGVCSACKGCGGVELSCSTRKWECSLWGHILGPGSVFLKVSWVCKGDLLALCGHYRMTEVKKEGEETALSLLRTFQLDDLHWDIGAVSSRCFLPSTGRALYYACGGGRHSMDKRTFRKGPPSLIGSLSFGSR